MEIKSKKYMVYFAGAVAKGDFRSTITHNSRVMSEGHIVYQLDNGVDIIYGGPFALSCDHGCYHYDRHGFRSIMGCNGSFVDEFGAEIIDDNGDGIDPEVVFDRCKSQIKRSDIVFAYVSKELNCFGTFVEVGFAHAYSIPVFLMIDPSLEPTGIVEVDNHGVPAVDGTIDDLWFVKRFANHWCYAEPNRQNFTNFLFGRKNRKSKTR